MLPDRVSNPGPLTYESGALPIVLRGPAYFKHRALDKNEYLVIARDNFRFFLHKNICCDPSSELFRQDDSDEGSQHMVLMRNMENYHQILLLI